MAKNKLKDAFASAEVTGFGGIDRTSLTGDAKTALDMRNFRILSDGSLEKRCGYQLSLNLPAQIRAVWAGELEGSNALMALVGNTVYLTNPDTGTYSAAGTVGTSEGNASFFCLEGKLFLVDGGDVYSCTRTTVTAVKGYVPLYGCNWLHTGGSVNEPINQLSEHIRITYKLTASSASSVTTGIAAVSVDSLIINGVAKTSGYSLYGTTLNLGTTCALNSVIDVCLYIGSSYYERSILGSCTGASVYGGKYDTSVYCFGGSDKSRVFRSKYVSAAAAAASAAEIPDSCGLYFPVGYDFSVAAGGAEVTAVCRHYDRLLLFTADDARMTDLSEDSYQDIPVRPINSGVGCLGAGGVALCGNDPVTVSRDGIYRWTANTNERDESSAVKISLPVGDLLDSGFRQGAVAFNYREKDEIWIGNPKNADGRVFIYNYQLGKWYSFTGIFGECYFLYGGKPGFCSGSGIFLFNDAANSDCGSEITAVFQSRYCDMEQPGTQKRMKRCSAVVSGGSEISVSLRDSSGELAAFEFNGDTARRWRSGAAGDIDCHMARVYTGRFDYIGYTLTAGGGGRQRIFGITLSAGK